MASRGLMRNCQKVVDIIRKEKSISTEKLMDLANISISWLDKNRKFLLYKYHDIQYGQGQWKAIQVEEVK